MTAGEDNASLSPRFFEGRVLIEILTWDWNLSVGLSRIGPRKYRFQGGLDLVRTIRLEGRIQAPQEHRGHDIQVDVSPFGPEMRFGRRGLKCVGWFDLPFEAHGYRAKLLLPEADLTLLAVALSATTKYVHIWTRALDADDTRIHNYALSSTISEKVKPWAGVD